MIGMHVTQTSDFPHLGLMIVFSTLGIKNICSVLGKKGLIETHCVFKNATLRDLNPRSLIQDTKFTEKAKRNGPSQKSTYQTLHIPEGFGGMLLPTGSTNPENKEWPVFYTQCLVCSLLSRTE